MNSTLSLWQVWQNLENGRTYQILNLDDDEVMATTAIPDTGTKIDSFTWLSPVEEFLQSFKFLRMGKKPKF